MKILKFILGLALLALPAFAQNQLVGNLTVQGTATFSARTATRVPYFGASGLLSDDADMTFATDTLTVTKGTFGGITHIANAIASANSLTSVALSPLVLATGTNGTALSFASATNIATFSAGIVGTSATLSSLTSGRVPFASTAGLLSDDSDLTFSTDTLTFTKGITSSLLSPAATTLVLGTTSFGTSVTFASATGIPTFATHVVLEGVTSTGATGTGNLVYSASPALTGVPTAPTAAVSTNTTQIATTAFVLANGTSLGNATGTISSTVGTTVNGSASTAMRSDGAPALPATISGLNSITSATNTTLTLATLDSNKDVITLPHGTGGSKVQLATTKFYVSEPVSGYVYTYSLLTATSPTTANYWAASNGTDLFVGAPTSGGTLNLVLGNGPRWQLTTASLRPANDNTEVFGSAAVRIKQIFVTPTGIKLGDGTNGPTITASGTSPNENLILTPGSSGGTAQVAGDLQTTGTRRITADVTNATATMSNLTDFSRSVLAGVKYVGTIRVFGVDSTGADGIAFDLGGGSATFTDLEFGFGAQPTGATLGTVTSTTATTAITLTVVSTSDAVYEITFAFTVNAAGTFIPRFAQNSHSAGTATARKNSSMIMFASTN